MDSGFIYPPLKNWKFTIQFFSLLSFFFRSLFYLELKSHEISISRILSVQWLGLLSFSNIYPWNTWSVRVCTEMKQAADQCVWEWGENIRGSTLFRPCFFFFKKFSLRHAREIVFETTPSNRKNAVVWAISRIRRANDEYVLFRLDYQTVEEGGGPSGCTKSRKCWENVWSIRGIFHVGTWP